MARRSRRSSQQRDASPITSPDLGLLVTPRPWVPLPSLPSAPDLELEDRRRFSFESPQVAIRSPGVRSRIRMAPVGRPAGKTRQRASNAIPREMPTFGSPGQVMVCVRRKSRREVLFALRRTGKGGRARRRRSEFSNVRC